VELEIFPKLCQTVSDEENKFDIFETWMTLKQRKFFEMITFYF